MPRTIHVLGGGLAGLTAAVFAARAGHDVTLLEHSPCLGGRARSRERNGVIWNMGAHALYNAGAGRAILDELAIPLPGRVADNGGSLAVRGGRLDALPVGFMSMLTTGLLDLAEKLSLGELMAKLPRMSLSALAGQTYGELVATLTPRPRVREVMIAFGRLATYVGDVEPVSAAVVVGQLKLALAAGVTYLDGGWQTLVDGLAQAATEAGVRIELDARVDDLAALRREGPVVLAVPPEVAGALLGRRFEVEPVRAACLDLALDGLPHPRRWFALGIDTPTYFSVHTRYASLAPAGIEVVHAVRYQRGPDDTERDRRELERLLDLVQPGWRERVVEERFLPSIAVAQSRPDGRPGVDQGGGIYLAGDWVGDEGSLADAALASGREAARLLAAPAIAEREAA
ncbi:MAG: FAD-dependent oxidoreductase [Polyangiaceae bacterium]